METRLEGTGTEIQHGLRPTIGAGIEWHEGGGRGGDIAAPLLSDAALEELNDTAGDDDAEDALDEEETTGRFLHYQPWLTVTGKALEDLADEVFAAIPPPATTPGRSLRKDATERRKKCLRNLLANLVVLGLSPLRCEAMVVALRKEKRTRYDKAEFTLDVLTACIHSLHLLGIITIIPGVFRRTRTCIMLNDGFTLTLLERGVRLTDIGKLAGGETIMLREKRGRPGRKGELVDYVDDERSNRLRQEMEELNAALNAADIRLDGSAVPPIHMVRIFQQINPETPHGWSLHGRMYRGSPWLDLKSDQRHRLTIGGERLADLDYSTCFLSLAYIRMGAQLPDGDPYALPGLEANRKEVKQLTSSLFFRKSAPTRLPGGFHKKLPDGWNITRFVEAISAKHPVISGLFGTEVGFEFFATESSIMMAVVRELLGRGVVAMPCHDGALVAEKHKALAMDCMRRVSREYLGVELRVAEKPIIRPHWS